MVLAFFITFMVVLSIIIFGFMRRLLDMPMEHTSWRYFYIGNKKYKIRHASCGWSYAEMEVRRCGLLWVFSLSEKYEYPKEYHQFGVTRLYQIKELSKESLSKILDLQINQLKEWKDDA